MNPEINPENKIKVDPIDQINELLSHPIKMQIFYFLSTFGELSLSDLTELIKKSKTTLHHHTKLLEYNGILLTREKVTKNYKEILYTLNSNILGLIKSQDGLENAVKDGKLDSHNLAALFKSFSAFIFTVMEHFSNYLESNPKNPISEMDKSSVNMYITDYSQYSTIMSQINNIIQKNLKKKKKNGDLSDSYAIFTVAIPYGKIYNEFKKKLEDK